MNLTSRPSRPFIVVLLTAWAASAQAASPAPALPANYLPVPLVPQSTSYSCGPASLMAVMEYWNVWDFPESTMFKDLHTTPKNGTEEGPMAKFAQDWGLRAEIRSHLTLQDLSDALKDGTTVILDIQAWAEKPPVDWKNEWEDGHYVVLVAMDADYAYFMDPSAHGAYAYLPLLELLDRWHDYDNRHGTIRRMENLGILIHGDQPRRQFPEALIRMQ